MGEGELEKRMFAKLKTFCIHAPEVDEKGEVIDQYFHPSNRSTTDEEKKVILNEAKEEIWDAIAHKRYYDYYDIIRKWFGENE